MFCKIWKALVLWHEFGVGDDAKADNDKYFYCNLESKNKGWQ